jgi:hypothetical protein
VDEGHNLGMKQPGTRSSSSSGMPESDRGGGSVSLPALTTCGGDDGCCCCIVVQQPKMETRQRIIIGSVVVSLEVLKRYTTDHASTKCYRDALLFTLRRRRRKCLQQRRSRSERQRGITRTNSRIGGEEMGEKKRNVTSRSWERARSEGVRRANGHLSLLPSLMRKNHRPKR